MSGLPDWAPASARDFALEIAERIGGLGPIGVARFFSGAALKVGGLQFAFVFGGSLYLRTDERSRPAFEAAGSAPFSYPGKSKTVTVSAYYEAPGEVLDDDEALDQWAAEAYRAALAAHRAKPKRPRRKPPAP